MPEIPKNSLVLYKNRPARVTQAQDKLEIRREGGESLWVRPKDVTLLHPGPLANLANLQPQAGEIKTAWELLAGRTTTLAELAELAYGEYTPATAWAAWQVVDDGLYFQADRPETITARLPEEVTQEQAARRAKAAERQAWQEFLQRVEAGQFIPEDSRYLQEVEELALGQRSKSRVLRQLGRAQNRENAHALLLELGYWQPTINPYPQRFNLPTTPPPVELPPLPDEARLDLTHLPAFAIDDEGSQDPDDAISLEGSRLWVHVADAAALVAPDSPADLEARARGANLYRPEGTVPMLPPQATPRLGLGLSDTSPALSLALDLDPGSQVAAVEIRPSLVRVTRLTYAEAENRLTEDPFKQLYALAQAHKAHRREDGAIFLEFPEVKVRVHNGQVVIQPLPPLKSRMLVREAMLMAGQAVARFALERDIPFVFTTQDPPEQQEPATSLAEMFALRRYMQRSQIKSTPGSHAGLGLGLYTQATSPLRRYLDLVAHQQLRAHIRGETLLTGQEILERVGAAESMMGSIRQAERLSYKHWTMVYLMQHPGWQGQAILVDKYSSRRGRVIIPELGLESVVYLGSDLPLDSTLTLTLNEVNLPELEAHFQVE